MADQAKTKAGCPNEDADAGLCCEAALAKPDQPRSGLGESARSKRELRFHGNWWQPFSFNRHAIIIDPLWAMSRWKMSGREHSPPIFMTHSKGFVYRGVGPV